MTNIPLFSVLVPNYNNARYLEECLSSVFKQTYTHWEIIIVDDCSTDNSQEIYQKYKSDSRIKVFFNEKNMGCGYTKNMCARYAEGELCGFLDPDDALLENALDEHVKIHVDRTDVSIVYSKCYYCNEHLDIVGERTLHPFKEGENFLTSGQFFDSGNFASFKNDAYKKTSGITFHRFGGDDQDLYFKMEEVGKAYVLDSFTYLYRLHEGSASSPENAARCMYWNVMVLHDACVRRGLDENVYGVAGMEKVLKEEYGKGYLDAEKEIRSSKAYRLGRFIMRPIKWLKRIDR